MKIRKPKCHPNRKYYAKDLCGKCYQKQRNKIYYKKYKVIIIQKKAKWRKDNPEKDKKQRKKIL